MRKLSFEEFELHEGLGAGTVGAVNRVRNKSTGDEFALKLLSPGISQNDLIRNRFEREILVLSKLDHPNIVRYYGHGKYDGQLFFVMELMQGGTLKSLLANTGPLAWHEAADCARQLASALQHSHNHGIIHRDLKPGNVFLSGAAKPKLGDFGIALDQHEAGLTDTGLTVGTYAYMPPELVRGEKSVTGQVDLYALGCMIFEMVTGRTPFVGDGFVQLFEQHLNSPPPRMSQFAEDVPAELDELVGELLAKAPEDRPFNARAVQGRLNAMLEPFLSRQNVQESDADSSDDLNDLPAGEVRYGQFAMRERLQLVEPRPEVSWKKLGVVFAVLALGIAVAGVVSSLASR